jgi:hypothetical protein
MRNGSPRDYTSETGCSQQPIQYLEQENPMNAASLLRRQESTRRLNN